MIKRPFLIITICYIISIIWGIYFKKYISLFCISLFIINIYLYKKYKKNIRKNVFLFFNYCIIFIFLSTLIIRIKDESFNNFINGEIDNYNAIVMVDKVENESEYYCNYIVKVIKSNIANNNIKLYMKVKKGKTNDYLKYGDLINVKGNIQKAEERRNYKGFSYFDFLKRKNIYGVVYCDNVKILKCNSKNIYNMLINKMQIQIKNNLKLLIKPNNIDIALALLLGESSQISEYHRDIFSNANLSHILAISGMHVSYIIVGIGFLMKKTSKRLSKCFFIIFLVIFSSITGASPSVVRAVIMSILNIIASLVYKKSDTLNNIAISAFIILVINPYALFDLGFQLSFTGTLGIVLLNSRINSCLINIFNKLCNNEGSIRKLKIEKIIKIISVSVSANIFMFPIILYNYNTISFVFLISNLLVTPILGVLIFSGYFVVILSFISIKISFFPAKFFNFFIDIFCKIAEFSANIKWLRITVGTPKIFTIFLIYFTIFYYCYRKRFEINIQKILKRIFIFIIGSSIILNILYKANSNFAIHMVDVGQGDCTLIVTASRKTILVDGGGSESENYDVGEKVLVPYLLDRQIKKVDYLVISHFDSDHCKGLFSVMKTLNVKTAIVSKQSKISSNYQYFIKLAKERKITVVEVTAGDNIRIDKNTDLDILWPTKNQMSQNPLNNNSIVCKLKYRNVSVLFTGDIEGEAEKAIENIYGDYLKTDILKVAHHGSKTSSGENFLKLASPKIALIGVGKDNKFGHPNDVVLKRFNTLGCKVYRTDEVGEITLIIDKNSRIRFSRL